MKSHHRNSRRRRIVQTLTVVIAFVLTIGVVWRVLPRDGPKVAVVFSHFENIGGYDFAVVQVSNTGNQPVTFYGYGWPNPFYWIATEKGTNWSWDYTPGFDYSKVRPIKLLPGAKMPVRTGVPIPERWMVGFEYSSSGIADKLPRFVWRHLSQSDLLRSQLSIAWSDPLTRFSKPTNVSPPLATGSRQGKK